MNVTVNSPVTIGNKGYTKGAQQMPDHLYANQRFKQAVRSGEITVHARDAAAQGVQAGKNGRALQKSLLAHHDSEVAQAARSQLVNNKGLGGPKVSQAERHRAAGLPLPGSKALTDAQAAQKAKVLEAPPSADAAPAAPAVSEAQAAPAKSTVAAQAPGKTS